MHNMCVVLTNKDERESAEIRRDVFSYLIDNGFCGECGRFTDVPADYAVIGGRYNNFFNENAEMCDDNDEGDENSAVIVTEEIWENKLKELKNSELPSDLRNETCIFDIEYDDITKENVINKKWAVIIDFHF